MTSEVFVWRWHPNQLQPVLCGRLYLEGEAVRFVYRRLYRESADALALSPNLPLQRAPYMMRNTQTLPRALADAAPDAWGRRVIEYRSGLPATELGYLLGGAGDRVGAFEFTGTVAPPQTPSSGGSSLEAMVRAAEGLEINAPLDTDVVDALEHGTSIGGARPKALLQDRGRRLVAKFSSTTDTWPVVRCEVAAMRLAGDCGIQTPRVELRRVADKDVMLVERFDRVVSADGKIARRQMLSALGLLGIDEVDYAEVTYPDLAEALRRHGHVADARELFRRMVFNILIGNTDDHAKNHAVFWDGLQCELTPAYDIVAYRRVGHEARQAMVVGSEGRDATVRNALTQSGRFGYSREAAIELVDVLEQMIAEHWRGRFEEAGVPDALIQHFAQTSVLSTAVRSR